MPCWVQQDPPAISAKFSQLQQSETLVVCEAYQISPPTTNGSETAFTVDVRRQRHCDSSDRLSDLIRDLVATRPGFTVYAPSSSGTASDISIKLFDQSSTLSIRMFVLAAD